MSRAEASGVAALLTDYRRFAGFRLWGAFALMILGALAEGFGLLMIVPLAAIAVGKSDATYLDLFPVLGNIPANQRFLMALALFLAAMGARSLLLLMRDIRLARLQSGYEASLRLRAAATLARRGWPFASNIGQSGMQTLLLSNVPRASEATACLQQMTVGAVMLSVQLLLAFILSPALTLVALAFLVSGSLLAVRFTRGAVVSGLAISQAMDESGGSGFRLHAGLKAALAQGTVPAFLAEYGTTLRRTSREFTRFARHYSLAHQAASFGAAVVAAILLFVGISVLALPFPILAASLVLFARMSAPAQQLQTNAVRAAAYAPAFAAIEHRLGKLDWNVPHNTPRLPLDWSKLRVEAVHYEHLDGLGIKQATIELTHAQWIGIAGASGAGKTTLVDLITGLLEPTAGTITVDGEKLEGETLERWRAALAYVGQEGAVFNDSVRGNLLAEGTHAVDVDLWDALDQSGLAARVRAFPHGLDESVGDRGSQLSGGERQRLMIARALLRRPTLLILDEATSALDPASEASLLTSIKSSVPRPAAIVVAHRESTLNHCDLSLEIQHGVLDPR